MRYEHRCNSIPAVESAKNERFRSQRGEIPLPTVKSGWENERALHIKYILSGTRVTFYMFIFAEYTKSPPILAEIFHL